MLRETQWSLLGYGDVEFVRCDPGNMPFVSLVGSDLGFFLRGTKSSSSSSSLGLKFSFPVVFGVVKTGASALDTC